MLFSANNLTDIKLEIERQFIRIQLTQTMYYSFNKIVSFYLILILRFASLPFRSTVIRDPGFS